MALYNKFEVVAVPFPFIDSEKVKRRPAVVISSTQFNKKNNHVVCLMITSSQREAWPNDIEISSHVNCGLKRPSKIRFKAFSIHRNLIIEKVGDLKKHDKELLRQTLKMIFID